MLQCDEVHKFLRDNRALVSADDRKGAIIRPFGFGDLTEIFIAIAGHII